MSHPLDRAPITDVWAPPLPPPLPVGPDLHSALPVLAAQGRWREVASRCRQATATDTAAAMSIAAYHLLALVKLNILEEAAAELGKLGGDGGALGDAGGASLGAGGTVVPFALRRIRAELPYWLGRQEESINRLYQLLEWCAEQEATAAAAATAGTSSSGNEAAAAQRLWGRRHRDVLLTLVNRHCRGQQYPAALALLDRLLQLDGSDAEAWQEVGMVQALLGDTAAAATSLQRMEHLLQQQQQQEQQPGDADSAAMATPQLSAQQRQRLLHRNRGLLAILQHDYRGAAREYQAALALDPTDATAANNHALALMYSNQLGEAVAALEAAFRRAPVALLQEPVVSNLASMLELAASPTSLAEKRRFAGWVHTVAPDDFDISATRTPGA
ncbi:hypothetical protein ABPG77_009241 [Micractinium sp. CCAP 211/92]